MREKYQRPDEDINSGSSEADENYQWYMIDISDQINEGLINELTFEDLIELLKQDNAQFVENNIKLKHEIYWITIGDRNFGKDFTNEEDEFDDDEIILLLESQKRQNYGQQDSETVQKLSQNVDKINIELDRVQQRQNDFARYFSLDSEDKFKDVLYESLNAQFEKSKEQIEDLISNSFNQYSMAIMLYMQQSRQEFFQSTQGYQNNLNSRNQSNNTSHQGFMEQSFQCKPQQQYQQTNSQTFNFNISEPTKNNLTFSQNFHSIELGINKQETREESIYSNELNKLQSVQVKSLVDQEMDSALQQKTKLFANILQEEETRNKTPSAASDSIFKTIPHLDSKQNNNSSFFNPTGLQSKSDSLKGDVNSSNQQNPFQPSITELEHKQSDKFNNIFQINLPKDQAFRSIESSQNDNKDQSGQAPFLFNIPQESNSPEIDFFKNVKPKKSDNNSNNNNNKVSSYQPDSSQPSARLIEDSSSQNYPNNQNKTLNQSATSLNASAKNTPNPFQSSTGAGPKIHFLLPDAQPQHLSSNNHYSSNDLLKDNVSNIFNFISKKQNQQKDSENKTQTRKSITRNIERRQSRHTKNLSDSKGSGLTSNVYGQQSAKSKLAHQTDMTILYSEPIVKQVQNLQQGAQPTILPAGDPVDYELEIQKLNEFLKESNKQIKLDIIVANLDNLEKAFARNTQILHIMCHGDYSDKEQQYYLAFEDEESKLDAITSKRFQEFLKKKNSNVKLVFFNACHSEEVGKIFQEAGIPFVIAVQSDLKIEDKAALTFSSSFYMNIFSGFSVLESFESAKSSLQAKQHDGCFTCCCAHSHDDNCLWFIEAMNHGFDQAHEQHRPQARCKCPNGKKMFHDYQCQWAHEFLRKYKDNYEDYIDEVIQSSSELFVCCCHTITTPHDESLKFRLIKNPNQEDCKIMSDLPEGNIIEKSNLDFNHPIFQDQSKIFGRQNKYDITQYQINIKQIKVKNLKFTKISMTDLLR